MSGAMAEGLAGEALDFAEGESSLDSSVRPSDLVVHDFSRLMNR